MLPSAINQFLIFQDQKERLLLSNRESYYNRGITEVLDRWSHLQKETRTQL